MPIVRQLVAQLLHKLALSSVIAGEGYVTSRNSQTFSDRVFGALTMETEVGESSLSKLLNRSAGVLHQTFLREV